MKLMLFLVGALVTGAMADLAERVGVLACDEIRLELPAGTPDAFDVHLGASTLHLERHSTRAPDFRALVQADGRLLDIETPVRTYRGTVDGDPATRVAAMLFDGRLEAWIEDADGSITEIVPDPDAGSNLHAIFSRADRIDPGFVCGTEDLEPVHPVGVTSARADDCLRLARIAYDCDYRAYQHINFGNRNVDLMISRVEQSQSVVDLIYARDVLVTFEISAIIVRTEEPDPYPGPDSGDLLNQLRDEFLNNQGAIEYDVAHLISATCCADGILGLAWVGVVCSDLRFGISRTLDPVVISHEVGHNFGAPHCLGPVDCDIMCGGGPTSCATFSPDTMNVMLAHRDSRTCLDPAPPYGTALPPVTRDDHAVTDGAIRIDVLANDYDANCVLSIFTHDEVSANGGTIERSIGTGPDGRDELLFTPVGPGADSFSYLAGDISGATFGAVTVDVIDTTPTLVAHYPLDETGGTTLQDTGPYDGTFEGSPLFGQDGVAGTSIGFDADQDQASVPEGVLPNLHDMTISVWFRPDGDQDRQVILSKRNHLLENAQPFQITLEPWDGQMAGRELRVSAGLRTMQGIEVPVGAWTHVALSIDQRQEGEGVMTLFVDGLPVETITDAPIFFDDDTTPLEIASYYGSFFSGFRGRVDDVQIYAGSLRASQIRHLHLNPGEVVEPCAADITSDGLLDVFDVLGFLAMLDARHPGADWNLDTSWDIFDLLGYLGEFESGC